MKVSSRVIRKWSLDSSVLQSRLDRSSIGFTGSKIEQLVKLIEVFVPELDKELFMAALLAQSRVARLNIINKKKTVVV